MFHNIYILLLNLDVFFSDDDIAFQNGFIYTCAKFTKKYFTCRQNTIKYL